MRPERSPFWTSTSSSEMSLAAISVLASRPCKKSSGSALNLKARRGESSGTSSDGPSGGVPTISKRAGRGSVERVFFVVCRTERRVADTARYKGLMGPNSPKSIPSIRFATLLSSCLILRDREPRWSIQRMITSTAMRARTGCSRIDSFASLVTHLGRVGRGLNPREARRTSFGPPTGIPVTSIP